MADGTEPFKVGILQEGIGGGDPDAFERGMGGTLRMRFDDALADGEVDRPIEIVVRAGRGLPSGTAKAVCDAWTALADDGVLVIIGPAITDNCIAVTPLFEARGVPTINFPGTTKSRGRYGFHYQLGALYGDGPLIVRAMQRRGLSTVAVVRDRSPIGAEFFEYFEEVARADADALAYLGFGGVLLELSRALTRTGWDPPRFTTSAGMHFYGMTPDAREEMSGWVYVDMFDEDNVTYRAVLDRIEARDGNRPTGPMIGAMWDMATLAVLGIRNAPVYTPAGVTEGLERIQQ